MEFDFRKLRLTIDYYKGIKKVFICFTGDFKFLNGILINATQSVFFTVVIIYFWVLGCFIGFKCKGNRKVIRQFSFDYG